MAIRVERGRQHVKTGQTSCEVSYAVISLGLTQARAQQLATPLCNHWQIEDRLHYVRDLLSDLAYLTNTAISIVRSLPDDVVRGVTPAVYRHSPATYPGAANTALGPFGAGPWSPSEIPLATQEAIRANQTSHVLTEKCTCREPRRRTETSTVRL